MIRTILVLLLLMPSTAWAGYIINSSVAEARDATGNHVLLPDLDPSDSQWSLSYEGPFSFAEISITLNFTVLDVETISPYTFFSVDSSHMGKAISWLRIQRDDGTLITNKGSGRGPGPIGPVSLSVDRGGDSEFRTLAAGNYSMQVTGEFQMFSRAFCTNCFLNWDGEGTYEDWALANGIQQDLVLEFNPEFGYTVPEPTAALVFGAGLLVLAARRKKDVRREE